MTEPAALGGPTYYDRAVFNALVPKEGPKALPVPLAFSASAQAFSIDLTLTQYQKFMSMVQGAFVDNSASGVPLYIINQGTRQTIEFPAASQGYVPLLASAPTQFLFQSAGQAECAVILINVPVPALIWGGLASSVNSAGTAVVAQITASTVYALALAANGARRGAIVTNGGTVPVYWGPDDTVAASTGAEIPPGESLNIDAGALYTGAIYVITASGSAVVSATEFSA